MFYSGPRSPREQAAAAVLHITPALLIVLAGCYAARALGITPREWAAGLLTILMQLSIQRALER